MRSVRGNHGRQRFSEEAGKIHFDIKTTLQDEDRKVIPGDASKFDLQYAFESDKTTITAKSNDGSASKGGASLVIPVISQTGEQVRQISDRRIEITKPGGTVIVEANVPLIIKETKKGRVFNQVPGCEAVPIFAQLPSDGAKSIISTISIAS